MINTAFKNPEKQRWLMLIKQQGSTGSGYLTWPDIVPKKWQRTLKDCIANDQVKTEDLVSVYRMLIQLQAKKSEYAIARQYRNPNTSSLAIITSGQDFSQEMQTLSDNIDAKLKQLAQSPSPNASGTSSCDDGPSADGPSAGSTNPTP